VTKPKPDPDTRFRSKLTPELVAQIRQHRSEGVSVAELARRHGVARSSIAAIFAGRTHRVPAPDTTEPK